MFNFRLELRWRCWCSVVQAMEVACCGSGLNTALYFRPAACGQEQNLILPDGSSIRRNMGFSDREWGRESDSQSQPHVHFPSPTPLFLPSHTHHTPPYSSGLFSVKTSQPTNTTLPLVSRGKAARLGSRNAIMAKRAWAGYGQQKKNSWRGRGGKRNSQGGSRSPSIPGGT